MEFRASLSNWASSVSATSGSIGDVLIGGGGSIRRLAETEGKGGGRLLEIPLTPTSQSVTANKAATTHPKGPETNNARARRTSRQPPQPEAQPSDVLPLNDGRLPCTRRHPI
jgi:hypothetical protein